MHGVSPDSEWTTLLAGFIVAGVGIGTTNPGIGQAAIAVVPVEKSGMGSGINTTFRQVGIATGVAALGAIFQSRVDSKLTESAAERARTDSPNSSPRGARKAAVAVAPPGSRAEYAHASTVAFVSGFNEIILIAAAPLLRRRRARLRPRPLEALRSGDRRGARAGRRAGRRLEAAAAGATQRACSESCESRTCC